MKSKPTSQSAAALDKAWAAFNARRQVEKPPAGFITASDYANRFGVSLNAAKYTLTTAEVTKRRFRIVVGGRLLPVWHYRPKV